MTSRERVEAALDFEPVDYTPMLDQYWGNFIAAWRDDRGLPPIEGLVMQDAINDDTALRCCYNVDIVKTSPVEAPWPSQAGVVSAIGHYTLYRDDWGRLVKRAPGSVYGEPIELPIKEKSDLDNILWEDVMGDARYDAMLARITKARNASHDPYIAIKVGGPYLRSSFLRGEVPWYMDLAQDEAFASALMARVTNHLIRVGVEAYRRSGLENASIWIFDDVAANKGPLISPDTYERLVLPNIRRMVEAFRQAGAAHVGLHSDGDIRPLLDGLVDAGISLINPVEPQAGMDIVELRERYGDKLAFVGGLCNSRIMPFGTDAEVRDHVDRVMSIKTSGGLVVGSHTISGEISVERYEYIMRLLHQHGRPLPKGAVDIADTAVAKCGTT